jgi:hypothetical protein
MIFSASTGNFWLYPATTTYGNQSFGANMLKVTRELLRAKYNHPLFHKWGIIVEQRKYRHVKQREFQFCSIQLRNLATQVKKNTNTNNHKKTLPQTHPKCEI